MVAEIAFFVVGILAGGILVWFIQTPRLQGRQQVLADRNARLEADLSDARGKADQSNGEVLRLTEVLATTRADLVNSEQRRLEFAKEFEEMKLRIKAEFEILANRILEEKSAKFTTQNQTQLEQLLTPLKQQIGDFKQKVEQVYTSETADRAALRTQIESLAKLNVQVTEDAKNLTQALKGDSKVQGNWGELILEKVLERSGLTRDVEFRVQANLKSDAGMNLRPDVIINLPEKKHFVIDAKVSLTAYERFCNSEKTDDRDEALRQHAQSLRSHVQELASKQYQDLYQISAPDFVFMFIPVEPALAVALQKDSQPSHRI